MTNKGYFAAGLLTMAALGGILVAVVKDKFRTSGDDDRVVVAGGSLTIGSKYGFEKDTGGSFVANHKHKRRTVKGGVIIIDGVPLPYDKWPDGPIEFDIAYCKGACDPDAPDDKVTIFTNSNARYLRVRNTNDDHKVGDEAANAPDPKNINHQPEEWKVKRIRDVLHNQNYTCATGKCSVLPIYRCLEIFGNCEP